MEYLLGFATGSFILWITWKAGVDYGVQKSLREEWARNEKRRQRRLIRPR